MKHFCYNDRNQNPSNYTEAGFLSLVWLLLIQKTQETSGCKYEKEQTSLAHIHTPSVSCRLARLVAVCRGLMLLFSWSLGFGRSKFLTVWRIVTECLWLTAAVTHQAEGQKHVEVYCLLDWFHWDLPRFFLL